MRDVSIILWLQSFANSTTDVIFSVVTYLGATEFFLVAIPPLLWCVDASLAMRSVMLLAISGLLNSVAKELFQTARPSPDEVRVIMAETGPYYAFPSGHLQNATVFWGFLALVYRRAWALVVAAAIILSVGISRLYLGLHFPIDLLGGFALGATLLALGVALGPWPPRWMMASPPRRTSLPLAWVLPLLLVGSLLVVAALPTSDTGKLGGVILGGGAGYILERRFIGMVACAPFSRQMGKATIGIAGLALIYFLFKTWLPGGVWAYYLRYAALSLWVTLVAPYLFIILRLGQSQHGHADGEMGLHLPGGKGRRENQV